MNASLLVPDVVVRRTVNHSQDLRLLFHRLNNQLGIIMAHSELLESKAIDPVTRSRASQVLSSALEAMGTIRDIRQLVVPPSSDAQ